MTFGHRFGSEKKIAHCAVEPLGEGRKDTKLQAILRLIAALPLGFLHRVGTVLGWIMYGMSPTYRRHLRENLRAARYDDSRVRRGAIAAAGQMIMELPALWLRPNAEVAALVKETPGAGEGEWSDFFGRPAYSMTLAAKLAGRDNVACYLAFARRLPRGAGYSIVVRPLPPAKAGESATRRMNRALEELIAECPEQYL